MKNQETLDLFSENEKFMKGRPLVTIFHNEQNLYTVLRIRVEETNEEYQEKEVVVTGYFPKIHDEETYIFYGSLKEHPKFGIQFNVSHFKKEIPQTKQGIVMYLSSDLFPGVGVKTAERIVKELGEDAISIILRKPSVLEQVPRLSSETAQTLHETLVEHQGLEQVMIGLNQYGFGPQISMKIYQAYKEEALNVIQDNPYRLIEDVEGIGFGRADELGAGLGITGTHPDRVKAGCLYTLEQQCLQNGHVYMTAEDLLERVQELLENSQPASIPFQSIADGIVQLKEEGKLIGEEQRVYMPSLYFSEKGLVTNIDRIMDQDEYTDQFPESEFLMALGELEERLDVQYAPSQKEAIQKALTSPLMILTGGPGTGKTTVIQGIVELYAELHGLSLDPHAYKKEDVFPFVLAAPTGRAAKRMSESTGLPAMTIHRLLGMTAQEDLDSEGEKEVEGKLIIIDEMSMVDIWLAHQLFKALPDQIQVILVGDEDQLPSVGPGQVLKDMLSSGVLPTVQLTQIYRQADGSSIVDLAHEIKQGKVPDNITVPQADRSFIKCHAQQMGEVVEQVVKNAARKGFSPKDIQVLAPMYRGPAGIDQLNKILQEVLNPKKERGSKELSFGEIKYRIGDKILQLVNQPEKNVFNGDIGEVISILYAKENIDKQDQLIVSFEGTEVTYTRQDFQQITHAFCCSIHKSQGSEFPIVILPVVRSYYRMLRRNLLYTAITRSQKFLIICGEESSFRLGIERKDDQKRQTTLCEKLVGELNESALLKSNEVLPDEVAADIPYEKLIFMTDPMVGMENVSPYDFMG